MLSTLARLIRPSVPRITPMQAMLATVIDTVGGGIERAKHFEERLSSALEVANAYFDGQIAMIPGPQAMSAAGYAEGQWLHAVFPEADDIGRAFGRSLEVKESLFNLAAKGHAEVHALLGMRRRPGSAGSLELAYADHTLRSLAPRDSDTRDYLRLVAIKRLLNNFAEHVTKLRRRERILKLEWNIRNEIPDTVAGGEEYVTAAEELTPDRLLEGLIAWLAQPSGYFRVERADAGLAGDMAFPLLHSSDRRQWLVCTVRFPVEEALAALERETHTHRHIFI